MPLRICGGCGKLSPGPQCAACTAVKRQRDNARYRPHRDRRPDYGAAERTRRADTVKAWVDRYGYVCPGWKRAPHAADPQTNPLSADHMMSVARGGAESGPLGVLCRSCNSSKGSQGS